MVAWRILGLGAVGGAMIVACGGGAETGSGSGGEGGVITGAGGGDVSTSVGGAPTTTGVGATTTTTGPGGTGGIGGVGGTGGAGAGPTCTDIGLGEPNEAENQAWPLQPSAIEDCDGDGDSITGTIAPGDVDWFVYEGDDTTFCVVDPTRSFSQSQSGLRLCKYVECINGNTELSCPSGTTEDTSAEDRIGCCGTSGFDITDLNCTGSLDEHVFVYIRIDQPGGDASTCNEYALSYHY